MLASFAAGMVAFSMVSMSLSTLASAENTLYLAQNGPASAVNTSAPGFTAYRSTRVRAIPWDEHAGHYTS